MQKQTFREVSEFFENLRKSSEKIGKCRKVLKTTFQIFLENCRNSSEIFGKNRKMSESSQVLKIFGNFRKCSEMLGKLGKPSENFECNGKFTINIFITFQTDTCILKTGCVICTGVTLFALVLLFNCIAVSQS